MLSRAKEARRAVESAPTRHRLFYDYLERRGSFLDLDNYKPE
jgi:hypothetical protein